MSSKDNFFNVYFMKIGWAWLIFIVGSFVYLTSATYGCGKRIIIQQHMGRLVIGTVLWVLITKWLFVSVEQATGTCLGKSVIPDRWLCVTSGFQWHSFDVSGHAFLLIYMNLVTVEEAQAIVGWDCMHDMIFQEEHHRKTEPAQAGSAPTAGTSEAGASRPEPDLSHGPDSPLRSLSSSEFSTLKEHYEVFTPYIRVLFILMTLLSLSCDVLLACTVVYFHTMPQKLVGGACAMAVWYLTYRVVFRSQWPGLPGDGGLVRYQGGKEKPKDATLPKKKPVIVNKNNQPVPMFMGMPLYHSAKKEDKTCKEGALPTDDLTAPASASADGGRSAERGAGTSFRRAPLSSWR
ncbi:Fat storage-inducing transmembrane protein [Trinorchestia longiramus]|nr:Fat storage-inducing transmembrane protein [Trinorchestia longiramus]